jgi:YebC/PmpR family DNA-binding regulatory protein
MAGHSQFKNIMHRKGAQDAKRAKLFTKIIREIITAARTGQPSPEFNARLRNAILAAREVNMPKDKIEQAMKRGSSPNMGDNYEEMRYEGYGPGGVAVIIEALTDNRNRTASEIRSAFTKHGGTLGEMGSVSYLFEHVGIIEYSKDKVSSDSILELILELGAKDCVDCEDVVQVVCNAVDLHATAEGVAQKFSEAKNAFLTWIPSTKIALSSDKEELLNKMLLILEDNDDVQNIFTNHDDGN